MLDLIIIGGSATGTAAAVYASRAQINFKVIAKDLGGEVANSGEVGNYPGFNETNGIELSQKFNDQLKYNKVEPEVGVEVENITKEGGVFKVQAKEGKSYEAKTIILATGVRPRHLKVPGEEELYQKGLSYCSTCDGPLFKNKIVTTIGGGNAALESILMMSGLAEKVYAINKNPEFQGEQVYIKKLETLDNVELIYNASTTKILGDQVVSGVEYKATSSGETKTIETNGVFVHVGIIPNTEMVKDLNVLDKGGFVEVNNLMETKLSGFFAAGDVVNLPYNQIAISTGQGVTAFLTVQSYLNKLG
ncbi:FAD-dependent oxidoreductase [Patescibacteria group bacterium]|nr:FAD-dependent oxidoreductase [Patescibacteria group bacterium]MBU1890289.1 FAD-dependent oxidoreductase [Patescibacteria group bacterium]